jgi:PleD family two-component response regulator
VELIRQRIIELNLRHEASPAAEQVTLSFGIASSDSVSAASPADLLHASDIALYDAKRRGRNQIALFDMPPDRTSNLAWGRMEQS